MHRRANPRPIKGGNGIRQSTALFLRQHRRSAQSNIMPIPDPALAFFIIAHTKPIEGCADKFGTCARVVLWNTPSTAAANEWARDYVNATLLCRSSQKLTDLKVLPIHDRLLAAAETIEIQWPLLVEEAARNFRRKERGSTMALTPPKARRIAQPPDRFRDRMRRLLKRTTVRFSRPSYYIAFHAKRAFILRATDLVSSAAPLHYGSWKNSGGRRLSNHSSLARREELSGPIAIGAYLRSFKEGNRG